MSFFKREFKAGGVIQLPSSLSRLSDMSDQELLERFLGGDKKAFAHIVDRFKKRIHHFVYFQIHQNAHDAEEITQDVFVELYKHPERFRGDSQLLTFLYGIARNLVLNYFRSQRRQFTNSTEPLTESISDENCPYKDTEDENYQQKIFVALESLSIKDRQVIFLCDNEGFSYQQISEILDINIGTVRSRINTARNRLIQKLKEVCDEL